MALVRMDKVAAVDLALEAVALEQVQTLVLMLEPLEDLVVALVVDFHTTKETVVVAVDQDGLVVVVVAVRILATTALVAVEEVDQVLSLWHNQ